jgi:DnaJ-domain-containing protein 1
VTLYLLYTIYEADHDLRSGGSYYSDLGVPLDATEREIKSRFRRMAALYHPDKATGDQEEVNAYFVHLKTASDTLLDPARRFAYERFGPDMLAWQHCKTIHDFVMRGAQVLIPYYFVAAATMYVIGMFGYLEWGRYERWLLLVLVFVFELHTITRPGQPVFFDKIVNPLIMLVSPARSPYLPFQIIALLRKVSFTMYIAFSQVGPLLSADTSEGRVAVRQSGKAEEELLKKALERLETAAAAVDTDASRLLEMELIPFAGDEEVLKNVRIKIKEWLVQNTIRSDPMVRDALEGSVRRRRVDAPAGAKGNR